MNMAFIFLIEKKSPLFLSDLGNANHRNGRNYLVIAYRVMPVQLGVFQKQWIENDFVRLPQAEGPGRQRGGILRQVPFITTSKKGMNEPIGQNNLDR